MLFLLRRLRWFSLHRRSRVFRLIHLVYDLHPRRATLYDAHSICTDKIPKQVSNVEPYFIARSMTSITHARGLIVSRTRTIQTMPKHKYPPSRCINPRSRNKS